MKFRCEGDSDKECPSDGRSCESTNKNRQYETHFSAEYTRLGNHGHAQCLERDSGRDGRATVERQLVGTRRGKNSCDL